MPLNGDLYVHEMVVKLEVGRFCSLEGPLRRDYVPRMHLFPAGDTRGRGGGQSPFARRLKSRHRGALEPLGFAVRMATAYGFCAEAAVALNHSQGVVSVLSRCSTCVRLF